VNLVFSLNRLLQVFNAMHRPLLSVVDADRIVLQVQSDHSGFSLLVENTHDNHRRIVPRTPIVYDDHIGAQFLDARERRVNICFTPYAFDIAPSAKQRLDSFAKQRIARDHEDALHLRSADRSWTKAESPDLA
jgi:hypothetical protein